MNQNIVRRLNAGFVIFDGGFGTMLQSRGLPPGVLPEIWNIEREQDIIAVHREYLAVGAVVLSTNTFGANSLKFNSTTKYSLDDIIGAAVGCARSAAAGRADVAVALDVGSIGKLVGVPGGISFEEAVRIYGETVRAGVAAGVDFILIETMNDIYELKAALLAAKENSELPIAATVVFDESGRMMSGSDPGAVVALLEGLGASAIGMNCSLGPVQMKKILPEFLKYTSLPVIVQPNAGLPQFIGGKTTFDVSPTEYAACMKEMAQMGARGLGGCCGTTPEYIGLMAREVEDLIPPPLTDKGLTMVSSASHALIIGKKPLLVGERINPTGKKRIKEALAAGDYPSIIAEGAAQADAGAHILDVNAGLPGISEPDALEAIVTELQKVTTLPLQIDTADPAAMERAMRCYCGVPLINSVNGKEESLAAILPLAKKYGGVLVGLTLDEAGIPADAQGRIRVAEKIFNRAEKCGIARKNIVIDPLAMSVSADPTAAKVTLEALRLLKERGISTLLGVSNISFGLPARDVINSIFFATALHAGLSLAIMNPNSTEMKKAYHSFLALHNMDESFAEYIAFAAELPETIPSIAAITPGANVISAKEYPPRSELYRAIVRGMKSTASDAAAAMLRTTDGMEVINNHIIPALGEVGEKFEQKKFFLPQLLMSADSATAAFARVKEGIKSTGESKGKIILATVKGDIHDIGKNIVRVLLENYSYEVIDLGRDVSYETILNSTGEHSVRLVGLSALMTTTLPEMEKAVTGLHKAFPDCRVMVGGAVLTAEYASMIGADYYAPDAIGAVRIAREVLGK